MAKRVAIIDKQPSRTRYSDYFDFEYDLWHMSSVPVTKLLKKDVDLVFDDSEYDLVILVGSEAAKEYAKITSVTTHAGILVDGKYVAISNPAMLIFKPEGKPDFQRTVDKIKKLYEGEVVHASESGDFTWITNADEAYEFFLEVYNAPVSFIAMDTEGTALYPRDGYVLGLSISYKPLHGRYIITDILDERHIELLQKIIYKFKVVFHNMKYDYKMIKYHLGLEFDRKNVHDTMVMHYVLDETDSHGLKSLAIKYTNYGDYDSELEEFKKEYCAKHGILQDDFTYDMIPINILGKYAGIDTAATLELAAKFLPLIEANEKLKNVYYNILIPGTLFLMDMEEVGIPIDVERMRAAKLYLDREIQAAKEAIYQYPEIIKFQEDNNITFNPGSVMQLRTVLFDYCKLQSSGKKTATGKLSTDAEVLEELSKEHKLPAAILKVRQLTKIQNTYISKILPELDLDCRIRTNFNLIFTTSGRLSSSGKFNAQQIPRDDPIIKGCIAAPPGYKIISQDLTTAEVYYAAVLSGDKNLQSVFKTGGDLHSTIAKMVFNLSCEVKDVKKLFPALRQAAKAITFGILYGSGPQKVAETVSKETGEYYSIETAKENIRDYFTKFSRLKKWLDERKDFISTNGYTYSFFGRKRRLTNVFSADKGTAAHEVRSGINSEIQSIASDVNLLAAIETANEIAAKGLDAKIFMLVHDSIVALVADKDVEEYKLILRKNTQKDRGCSIPGFPIGIDQEVAQDYSFGVAEDEQDLSKTKFVSKYTVTAEGLEKK